MAERYISNANAEVEFVKKHVASLGSAGGVSYNRDFALSPEERERKVPLVQVPVVQPPEPLSNNEASTSTADAAAPSTQESSKSTINLTIKSLKPPLTFNLACSPTADVASLKAQLHASEAGKGAPEPDRQRWLYKGKAMADERLLKEYDGIKDGETVHLSIKAAPAASATPALPSVISPMASPLPASEFQAPAPPKDKDTLSAMPAPSPFGFQSQTMSPASPSSKRRARTSSQLSSATNHSRVPSITLTTDIDNFNNLSGSATSPIDGNMNPGVTMAGSPEFGPTSAGVSSPPFSPGRGGASGASTPRSAPGTPYSGGGRGRTPSISIPIDLDNLDLMNPISSDRRLPVGLSPALVRTIREPATWSDLLDFIESKVADAEAANAAAKPSGRESPSPVSPSKTREIQPQKEYREETLKVFENWLGASKDWMNASDIARIRDTTGIFGMAGR